MASIIGSRYCSDNATDIRVVSSVLPIGKNIFFVTDADNNVVFNVNDSSTTFHKQRTLLDSNGAPIVTFRPKVPTEPRSWTYTGSKSRNDVYETLVLNIDQFGLVNKTMSMHYRWQAYRGESTNKKDIIFSAKQSKKELNVFLHDNDDEDTCDFKVDSSFVFHRGHSDHIIIAEAKEHVVKLRANIDKAFVVSLIVIMDGIREQEAETRKAAATAFKVGAGGSANTYEALM